MHTNRKAIRSWLMVLGLIISLSALYADNWVKLGKKHVSFGMDHDTIKVSSSKGPFRAIRLKVEKTGVHFLDLKVHFQNGDVADIPVQAFIGPGQTSPRLDLPGKVRSIEKVVFAYKSVGPRPHPIRRRRVRPQAKVTLYGIR